MYRMKNPPTNLGKKWSDSEIQQLLQGVKQKKTCNELAEIHQRTPGSISSRLRQLAADYYFNDNRPLDEIMKFTGLDKETILDAISKRQYEMDMKEKTMRLQLVETQQDQTIPQMLQPQAKKEYMTEILGEIRDMMKEMLVLMKETKTDPLT
jgi:hypothetical protein